MCGKIIVYDNTRKVYPKPHVKSILMSFENFNVKCRVWQINVTFLEPSFSVPIRVNQFKGFLWYVTIKPILFVQNGVTLTIRF